MDDPAPAQNGATAVKLLVLLALAIVLIYLGFMFAATEGHFVPQVVDLYLSCQYARGIAEGHPFQYNAGEPASTGSTSLLHTLILAAAHAVGIRGEGLIAFAIISGAGFYLGAVLLAHRLCVRIDGARAGLLGGLLVALSGPVVWGFLYGADIALYMLLALWLLERLVVEWPPGRPRWIVVTGCLLALARPEGLLIAVMLGAAWTFAHRERRVLAIWAPAGLGLLVLAFYRGLTGQWLGSSFADKSLLANYGLSETTVLVTEYLTDLIRGLLLGFYPSQAPIGLARGFAPLFFPPLALVAIAWYLVQAPAQTRTPLRLWAAMTAVVWVLVSPNMFLGAHFNRYLMWAFPGLLVLTALGTCAIAQRAAGGDARLERILFHAAVIVCVALGLFSTLRFAAFYGDMSGAIWARDLQVARFISKNLPRGARIANLATSVEYLTGHASVNLHGVTSPAFFGNRTAEREAGVLEALGRMPAGERPPYLLTTVATQESYPTLRELVDGSPLFVTSSFSDEILLVRLHYDLLGRNGEFHLPQTHAAVAGRDEVDRLNVCDSRDETAHAYKFRSRLGNMSLNGVARAADYEIDGKPVRVLDSGRLILGQESFRVHTRPGRELLIVARTAGAMTTNVLRAPGLGSFSMDIPEASILVTVDGQTSGRLSFRPQRSWDEIVIRVTANLITSETTEITLSGTYGSFYYWFFQA